MYTTIRLALLSILFIVLSCTEIPDLTEEKKNKLKSLEWITFGEMKPHGWIKEQMKQDLHYAVTADKRIS